MTARPLAERLADHGARLAIVDPAGAWTYAVLDRQASALAERDELENRHELLLQAMGALNERERHILTERRLKDDPVTLEELSQEYGVSRERIRQIEVRAFEKLQAKMRELARGKGMAVPA